ncbi:MAG TPA: hypothetical protein VGF40_09325 [Thermoanaerobaculia bacterium]
MKRVLTIAAAAAFAGLLLGCEPAHENIVSTAEPLDTAHEGVKEAPGVGEGADTAATATVAPAPATTTAVPPPTATETAAQQNTRTQ